MKDSQTSEKYEIIYNGKRYILIVELILEKSPPNDKITIVLDNKNIEEISYVSELNKLFISGSIIVTDLIGELSIFLNQLVSYCKIIFQEYKEDGDGEIKTYTLDEDSKFSHYFLISKAKILNREKDKIKYQFDLVGDEWLNCNKRIFFTNYDKDPQSILDIEKSILTDAQLPIDNESFNNVKSTVKINYITQSNDTPMSCTKYLFSRYFYLKDKEQSIKFIYYDLLSRTYKLFDLRNLNSLNNFRRTVTLSFFGSDIEGMGNTEKSNFATVDKLPLEYVFKYLFDKNFYDYDYSKNEFSNDKINTDQIITYRNNNFGFSEMLNGFNNPFSIMENSITDIKMLKRGFCDSGSYWNNNYDIYQDMGKSLFESNSMILNCDGQLKSHIAGLVTIVIDRDVTKSIDPESKQQEEMNKLKYKGLEGSWMIYRLRNILYPSKSQFKQNMILFRNFRYMMKPRIEAAINA